MSREAFCRISLQIETLVLSPCFTSFLSSLASRLLTEVLLCSPALCFGCCFQRVPYELITAFPAPHVHALRGLLVNVGSLCWLRGFGATRLKNKVIRLCQAQTVPLFLAGCWPASQVVEDITKLFLFLQERGLLLDLVHCR